MTHIAAYYLSGSLAVCVAGLFRLVAECAAFNRPSDDQLTGGFYSSGGQCLHYLL